MSNEDSPIEEPNVTSPSTTRRYVWAIQGVLVAALVGFWATRGLARPAEPAQLPIKGTLPAFALTDASGDTVTLQDLSGKVWIADLIFTRCGGQCLDMTTRMRDVHRALATEGNVQLVSISVDPTYDTPEVLTSYAQRHQVAADNWLFLTGSPEAVRNLARKGFRLAAEEADEEQIALGADMFLHSIKFVLVDGLGRIRGYYSSVEAAELHQLVADARRLARGPAL